jgi:hypothetical protein
VQFRGELASGFRGRREESHGDGDMLIRAAADLPGRPRLEPLDARVVGECVPNLVNHGVGPQANQGHGKLSRVRRHLTARQRPATTVCGGLHDRKPRARHPDTALSGERARRRLLQARAADPPRRAGDPEPHALVKSLESIV